MLGQSDIRSRTTAIPPGQANQVPKPAQSLTRDSIRSEDHPKKPNVSTLVNDGNLHASRVFEPDPLNRGQQPIQRDSLVLETGDSADTVHVSTLADRQIKVTVNGKSYAFNSTNADGEPLRLQINTKGGRDNVTIDADVMNDTTIEAGDGDDTVRAGGGTTGLFGGKGNDTLYLGSGTGYAEGNEGDDVMIGGAGNLAMYGNDGADRMYANAGSPDKKSYLDGGNGPDSMYAGDGHTVMHGGNDNDLLVGHNRTTFYTGKGKNTVWSDNPQDLIYATPGTVLSGNAGAKVIPVTPGNFGIKGFNAGGTAQFLQRFQDDLTFYNSSPAGQKMLAELDAAAERNGAPINVSEETYIHSSSYSYQPIERSSSSYDADLQETPSEGFISNGVAGSPSTQGEVAYNRSAIIDTPTYNSSPVATLFHELAHAYNGANGTFLPGKKVDVSEDGTLTQTPHVEDQAVGLANDATPFDFDGDPSTPATSFNPKPFTENGMREEMGVPLRQSYQV